jgi:ribose-phosphate pyrophosphokinase
MSESKVERGHVIGDVKDHNVIVVDDMISTAGSICQAISTCREYGAKSVLATATHGIFCGPAYERLLAAAPDEVLTTDTVPLRAPPPKGLNLTVHSVAPLLGEAILRIHENRSVSKMFQD